eukprot:1894973-Pyramimonas_sp.AAC.1
MPMRIDPPLSPHSRRAHYPISLSSLILLIMLSPFLFPPTSDEAAGDFGPAHPPPAQRAGPPSPEEADNHVQIHLC